MKRRVLALLLAVTLLSSMIVVPAYADENTGASITNVENMCPCGCGKTLDAVNWKVYSGTATTGHYYLTEDFSQATEQTIISGEKMVLDLRGHTITTETRNRLFLVSGYLAVLDSVGGGRLSARTPSTTGDYGGVVRIVDNETTGSMFELFSGTITPASATEKARYGGLVSVGSGGTFRMHDGMLLGGNSVGNGGGIYVETNTAKAEVLGGSIVGCTASANGGSIYSFGAVTLKNCTVLGGKTDGIAGNLYFDGGSLTVENSVIADGIGFSTGTSSGGNLSNIGGTKITIKDSVFRGGYSAGYGGNISFGYCTATVTNTRIYGGVANKAGANVALTNKYAKVTLTDCTIDGGVGRVLGALTLKGSTKISMNNGGLNLSEQTEKTTTATGLTSGAEVYVQGAKTLTGSLDYIKPLYRTTATVSGTTITLAKAADGTTAGYCPHCGEKVAWSAYGTAGATHTYLTANLSGFAEVTVSDSQAIDLAGYTLTATGRAFTVTDTGNLGILDSVGSAKLVGSGVNGEDGGLFKNAGKLQLNGGKYTYTKADGVAPTGGGVVYNSGELDIHGAQLVATSFAPIDGTTTKGGVIRTTYGTDVKVTICGARINGGEASYGGAAYFNYNNQVTINSATFTGGKALGGGNIYCGSTASTAAATANNKGKLILTGVSILDGAASNQYAGNLHLDRWNAELTDCYLEGGTTAKYGANLSYGVANTMNVTNSILVGGTAEGAGGNFYAANAKAATFTDCKIIGGSGTSGGNIYVNNGTVTIKGGEVSHGTATVDGGNIHANTTGGVYLLKNTAGEAPAILNGTATGNGGNIYAADLVTVTDAYFSNGNAVNGEDIYVAKDVNLTLGAGVTGDVRLGADASMLTADVFGGVISGVTCEDSSANYYLGGIYGDCGFFIEEGKLYVAKAAVIGKDGTAAWYSTNEAAVEACNGDSYVKLFTDDSVELTKDLYLDLNGNEVTISGDYTLYGMDSSGDDFTEPKGIAWPTDPAVAPVVHAPNGYTYIFDLADGEMESKFHRLDMKITGVSIRPSVDGIYYSAKWSCDDTVKAMISTYGVVASVDNMPDAKFTDDEANLWTSFAQDSFVSGESKNGAVISGIMKSEGRTAAENDALGKKPIYAKAYVALADGTCLVSGDNIQYSLYDVMKNLDRLITEKPIRYRKYNLAAREFYEKWKEDGMGGWKLNKIPAPTEDDGVIDVLMVGHSFCYYYVEELYELAKAAGISMRVCNLYYSSRGIATHYKKWQDGVADYQLFEISDDTGGVKVSTSSMSLEHALSKYEWDFIALQGGTSGALNSGEAYYEEVGYYSEQLLGYFLQEFPNARIGWHQAWTNQAGEYAKSNSTMTTEKQISGAVEIEKYAELVCGYFNEPAGQTLVQRIPTGKAWQNCRTADGYDYLCSRLGYDNNKAKMMHAGDGNHDGDIGGGQYLNACVWFEVITGQSVLNTTYVPEYKTTSTISDELFGKLHVEKTANGYKLTDDFAAALRQYAHDAVAELGLDIKD